MRAPGVQAPWAELRPAAAAQAEAIGDLEVASFSTSALALAITNAHLDERLVADVVEDGQPGYFSKNFVVLAEVPIHTIADVKGGRVATNVIGSASDTAMRTMFRMHGITDSDFTTVEANFANMPAMLDSGKADFIGTLPQFAQEPVPANTACCSPRAMRSGQRRRSSGRCAATLSPRIGRLLSTFRGSHPRRPLVSRSGKPRGGAHDPCRRDKAAEGNRLLSFSNNGFYHSPDAWPDVASVQKDRRLKDRLDVHVRPLGVGFSVSK